MCAAHTAAARHIAIVAHIAAVHTSVATQCHLQLQNADVCTADIHTADVRIADAYYCIMPLLHITVHTTVAHTFHLHATKHPITLCTFDT